jgi:putative membrane protein insertion efficiency factor
VKYVLIGLLKAWRLMISPLYGNVCRYYPSCSAYALRAVQVHGAVKGSWLAGRRLLRCHPWAAGGYDPVPGTPEFDEEMRDRGTTPATMERGALHGVPVGPPVAEPAGHSRHRHTNQGSAATVAKVRGVK